MTNDKKFYEPWERYQSFSVYKKDAHTIRLTSQIIRNGTKKGFIVEYTIDFDKVINSEYIQESKQEPKLFLSIDSVIMEVKEVEIK